MRISSNTKSSLLQEFLNEKYKRIEKLMKESETQRVSLLSKITSAIVKPSPKSSPLRPKPKPRPVLNQNQSPIGTGVTL